MQKYYQVVRIATYERIYLPSFTRKHTWQLDRFFNTRLDAERICTPMQSTSVRSIYFSTTDNAYIYL